MGYRKLTEEDIGVLREICSEDRVYVGSEINEDFSHDEMVEYGKFMPEVVVEAKSIDEVSRIMKYAYKNRIPVTPRGQVRTLWWCRSHTWRYFAFIGPYG